VFRVHVFSFALYCIFVSEQINDADDDTWLSDGGSGNALADLGGNAVVGGVGVDCQSTSKRTNQKSSMQKC